MFIDCDAYDLSDSDMEQLVSNPLPSQNYPLPSYIEDVISYLEKLDYPSLVIGLDVVSTTKALLNIIIIMRHLWSPRRTALLIYGATMTYQVIPSVKSMKAN